jgi:nickel/cobalt transporter (NicO) family protein
MLLPGCRQDKRKKRNFKARERGVELPTLECAAGSKRDKSMKPAGVRISIMFRMASMVLTLVFWMGLGPCAHAHPVPKKAHDRTIDVQLLPGASKNQVTVQVRYRLEVDEFTVVFEDLPALGDRVDLKSLREPREFYDAYIANYAPILADNLRLKLDGRPAPFSCRSAQYTLRDEKDAPLGHLRCDFVFETSGILNPNSAKHTLSFREGNYEFEEGRILLAMKPGPGVVVESIVEPDQTLKEKARIDLKPGEEAKLRVIEAAFSLNPTTSTAGATNSEAPREAGARGPASAAEGQPAEGSTLLDLLLDTRRGMFVLLLLAAVFGAAHALTPGHGKTLVAAYLVGERGTAWHAVVLGLVTTITHTGAVIILAALLMFFFPKAVPAEMQMLLGFVGGLLISGMGIWLLLRRLGGGADHFHVGGGHHRHDHAGVHSHVPLVSDKQVGWIGLILLGISGGIVPCWDAILMLGFAISAQRVWLAVPLLLAFSAGLAGVLVVIGLAVVYLKGFADSRLGESRFVRALPLVSAILVTLMGLGLCYESMHTNRSSTPVGERSTTAV